VTAQSAQANQRVLVVEDEFLIADSLATALLAAGLEVVGPAYSMAEALRHVECAAGINGAILDINLKNELAFPVADALSSRQIPFLITTGYDRQQLEGKYEEIARFEKPFDPAKVVAELRKRMASKQG
jgi:DNA-binding response OmpR family regulator